MLEIETYELFAYVPGDSPVSEEEAFAGMLEHDASGSWKGVSSNKVITQEELDKVIETIPNDYSPKFLNKETKDIDENIDLKLPVGLEWTFGRSFWIRRQKKPRL